MIRKKEAAWYGYLSKVLKSLTTGVSVTFEGLLLSKVPAKAGVYLISVKQGKQEIPYYVGRSKNLRNRIYCNHLLGTVNNARLKKYLVEFKECKTIDEAKQFIKRRCSVRWFLEEDVRKRGAAEGYVTGVVFPKYGISEEH